MNVYFEQFIGSMTINFLSKTSSPYINDLFKPACQHYTITKTSLLKLSKPLRKTNHGQSNLSYLAPTIWNNLPDSLKTLENINTYNHRVK